MALVPARRGSGRIQEKRSAMNIIDVSRGFPVETRTRRVLPSLRVNPLDAVMKTKDEQPLGPLLDVAEAAYGAVPPAPAASRPVYDETPHQKVFRLVRERRFEDAAKLAKRLIDAGDVLGFFIYGGTAEFRRTSASFADRVRASAKGAFSEIQDLTPQLAQVVLENNEGNRKIRVAGLTKRMRDIVDGRWRLTGQGLIVAKSGELNDGQHRAWAALLVGVSVRIPIFYGAARNTVPLLDDVEGRTGPDRFFFAGVKNYTIVSAMVGLAHRIDAGRAATESEKFDLYEESEQEYQGAAVLVGGLPKGSSPTAFGVATIFLKREGAVPSRVAKFMEEIKTGVGLTRKSPTLALRDAINTKTFKAPIEHQVYTIMRLFHLWDAGKKIIAIEIQTAKPKARA